MSTYTTLGEGRTAKLLAVQPDGTSVTVTTCERDTAIRLSRLLPHIDAGLPFALVDVANAHPRTPVEVRRRLLDTFDQTVAGAERNLDGAWRRCDELVAAVAVAVTGQPQPVIDAVRREVGDLVDSWDGILVPATISSNQHETTAVVRLDALHWDYLRDHCDLAIGVEGDSEVVESMEMFALAYDIYHARPIGGFDWSVEYVVDAADRESAAPTVTVRADDFVAWLNHHSPDDIDWVTAALNS